jgi:hypothetical protein
MLDACAWDNAEDADFWIESSRSSDGTCWLWLTCSAHGRVQATIDGQATDLGMLTIAAQRHYESAHAR